jgi:hypothetical protein
MASSADTDGAGAPRAAAPRPADAADGDAEPEPALRGDYVANSLLRVSCPAGARALRGGPAGRGGAGRGRQTQFEGGADAALGASGEARGRLGACRGGSDSSAVARQCFTPLPPPQAIQLINQLTLELDVHDAMRSVRQVALELLDCERVTLFLINRGRGELRGRVGAQQGELLITLRFGEGVAGHVAQTGGHAARPATPVGAHQLARGRPAAAGRAPGSGAAAGACLQRAFDRRARPQKPCQSAHHPTPPHPTQADS